MPAPVPGSQIPDPKSFTSVESFGEKRLERERPSEHPAALEDLREVSLAVVGVQLEELPHGDGAPLDMESVR